MKLTHLLKIMAILLKLDMFMSLVLHRLIEGIKLGKKLKRLIQE